MSSLKEKLMHIPLFSGLSAHEIESLFELISPQEETLYKDELFITASRPVTRGAYLDQGELQVLKTDIWGDKHVLRMLGPGSTVGVSVLLSNIKYPPVDVLATKDSKLITFKNPLDEDLLSTKLDFQSRLTIEIINNLADSNLEFVKKTHLLSQKNLRRRLLLYFSYEVDKRGSYKFKLPYSRQTLADYLSINRCSLSRELSRMQDEGLISFSGQNFEIHLKVE